MLLVPVGRSRVRRVRNRSPLLCFALLLSAAANPVGAAPQGVPAPSSIKPDVSVELPMVRGGFDLMAVDVGGERLFANAEDNNTTEVIDVRGKGRAIRSIAGMHQPKWVNYRPELRKLFVANGDGTLHVLDATTLRTRRVIKLPLPANNLRYDATTGQLLVGMGDMAGAIAIVDPRRERVTRQLPLLANPKQFEVAGDRLYANIPSRQTVQVIDPRSGRTLAAWAVCGSRNVPMALDQAGGRLFIGCEDGHLEVHATSTGALLAKTPIGTAPDGVWLDTNRQRLYVSSGQGVLDVIDADPAKGYASLRRLPTREGAGTSLLSLPLGRLFVALPQKEATSARIDGYRLDAFR